MLGNAERIREQGGRKAPSRTPDPTVSPSSLDCNLVLIHICPFSDSFFLVPKCLELRTLVMVALKEVGVTGKWKQR